MKKSKKSQILDWMKQGRSITPKEAIEVFHCYRLSAVIFDLKKEGHNISSKTVRIGDVNFAKYTLQSFDGRLNL